MMTPNMFHEAADRTNDPHDKAELHAAANVQAMMMGRPYDRDQLMTWMGGLVFSHAPLAGEGEEDKNH